MLMRSGLPKIEDLPANSIELETHTHDDVDENYTLSSKTESNRSVVITLSNRKMFIKT